MPRRHKRVRKGSPRVTRGNSELGPTPKRVLRFPERTGHGPTSNGMFRGIHAKQRLDLAPRPIPSAAPRECVLLARKLRKAGYSVRMQRAALAGEIPTPVTQEAARG